MNRQGIEGFKHEDSGFLHYRDEGQKRQRRDKMTYLPSAHFRDVKRIKCTKNLVNRAGI